MISYPILKDTVNSCMTSGLSFDENGSKQEVTLCMCLSFRELLLENSRLTTAILDALSNLNLRGALLIEVCFFSCHSYQQFSSLLSYPILSYPILSYPILSYPILSYPILSYPILSYPLGARIPLHPLFQYTILN